VVTGVVAAVVGLPVVTSALVSLRGDLARESVLLVYMLAVVVVAVIGGLVPALLAAVSSFLLANYFLTPPYNTFVVRDRSAFVDLVVFLLGALVVSVAVEVGARRRATAERDRMEAQLVSRFASAEMTDVPVTQVLDRVRALFAMSTVALASREGPLARVGPEPHDPPTFVVDAGAGLTLAAYGPELFARDQRLLTVLAESVGRAWGREQLTTEAARARQLAETDRVRSALLAAVSHDLRTPVAGIKTAASGLRQPGVQWGPGEEEELLTSIEAGADRLAALIDNLLAMSRIQAGALSVHPRHVALDEVVARALLSVGAHDVLVDVPEDLPPAWTDPGLLERVVANLVENALRWSPPDAPVEIGATRDGTVLRLDVIDHGPGVDATRRQDMFTPFQRLGDTSSDGVGLGLAIVKGLLDAIGGDITPSTSAGGGLTMSVTLQRSAG
jgi:two-component system sensor histidine kinase KdpD